MGNPTRVKVPFVVSRIEGKRALYLTAMELFSGDVAPDLQVCSLPVDSEDGAAVEVSGGDVVDVLLVNPSGGAMKAGDYELEGQGALLHYRGGKLGGLVVTGGSMVRVKGVPVTGG